MESVGLFLPPVIDLINKYIPNQLARFWVSIVISCAIAVALNFDKLRDVNEVLGSSAIIFAQAQIVYKTYWEKSQARESLFGDLKSR